VNAKLLLINLWVFLKRHCLVCVVTHDVFIHLFFC
jgi:hypothetical protein